MNEQERNRLRNELLGMKYGSAKHRLSRMDPHGRLRYWRNAMKTGEWRTRFDLPTYGTTVTLVETVDEPTYDEKGWSERTYDFVDVIVEPLPDNQT